MAEVWRMLSLTNQGRYDVSHKCRMFLLMEKARLIVCDYYPNNNGYDFLPEFSKNSFCSHKSRFFYLWRLFHWTNVEFGYGIWMWKVNGSISKTSTLSFLSAYGTLISHVTTTQQFSIKFKFRMSWKQK